MKNPTGNKLEKLVFGMFDQMVEGADKYVTKQGSTWLIFTESKKWVIEFTNDKTLWFNYNLFQNELDLIGKDCTEERDLIKNWFESRFLNKPKVWATFNHAIDSNQAVEDTIQNGVKEAHHVDVMKFFDKKMENTIENGVKHTEDMVHISKETVEDTIENGVKDTKLNNRILDSKVEDTIQNGVKETQTRMWPPVGAVDETIQNGVKDIDSLKGLPMEHVEYTIQNGVKHTIDIETRNKFIVEDTIQNGVKRTFDLELRNQLSVDETIENGVKETISCLTPLVKKVEDTIQNGVKHTGYGYDREESYIEDAIENGVKEVKTPGVGDLESTMDFMNENNTLDVQKLLDDVIENGVKETQMMGNDREIIVAENIYDEKKNTIIHKTTVFDIVEDTIQNGVKLIDYSLQIDGSCVIEDVIENGVKEIKSDEGYLTHFGQQYKANQTIENGVKYTVLADTDRLVGIEDTIENGVKETKENRLIRTISVISTINNGVKETKESMLESLEQIDHQVTNSEITENINDAIENGVKETKEISNISLMSEMFKVKAKQAIRDGVKELKAWKSNRCEEHGYFEFVDGIPTYTPMIQVKDVLENGVKEIQPLPAQDGNRDWGLYYHRQEDRTKPHTEYVKEVIEDSYNHRGRVEGVIRNTDKDGI